LGITRKTDKGIELRVHPTLIPESRLLANVNGVMNAVRVNADMVFFLFDEPIHSFNKHTFYLCIVFFLVNYSYLQVGDSWVICRLIDELTHQQRLHKLTKLSP